MNPQQQIKEAILKVVENQLEANDPRETRQTYERLLAAGYCREEALKLIGYVVGHEFFSLVGQSGKYDEKRFVRMLIDLPTLPWDK